MKKTNTKTPKTPTQLAADGLRRWLLEYADACGGDADALSFLAEVSEAIDLAASSQGYPTWPEHAAAHLAAVQTLSKSVQL
ncbi:MAG: hypothetical protein ACK44A_08140 [Roseateles sp.]